jgi:hypothetical protein
MNRTRKEALKEKIDRLEPEEHAQLFQIVQRYTDNVTKTQTGVLVSSDNLPDECLVEMETMVSFFMDQRKRLDTDSAQRKLWKTN